jgi:hypothetical protein
VLAIPCAELDARTPDNTQAFQEFPQDPIFSVLAEDIAGVSIQSTARIQLENLQEVGAENSTLPLFPLGDFAIGMALLEASGVPAVRIPSELSPASLDYPG